MGIFIKSEANKSSEQVKLQVNIIDLTEYDLKLIHAFSEAIESN